MPNFKLALCYDGTRRRGWQRQGNTDNTIQQHVEAALGRVLGEEVEIAGSGRTDAGVHARRQICSFRAKTTLSPEEILSRLRKELPEDIGAVSLEQAPPRFHARLSCTGKTYVYRIWNSETPCVFERRYVTVVREKLDVERMRAAAQLLIGRHDFLGFSSAKKMKHSSERTLREVKITREGEEIRIVLTGEGFLYNMARIIAGTLIEIGAARRAPETITEALIRKDRLLAGPTAPAEGLILWDAEY